MIDGVLSPREGPHQLEMVGRDKNKYCSAHDLMVDAKTGAPGASYLHLKSEWLLNLLRHSYCILQNHNLRYPMYNSSIQLSYLVDACSLRRYVPAFFAILLHGSISQEGSLLSTA